jgi:hypothetical protein
VGLDSNTPFRCQGNSIGDHLFETLAGFLFRIRDVMERGRETQLLFHHDHVQLGAQALSEVDGEIQCLLRSLGTIMGYQYLHLHFAALGLCLR